MIDFKKLMAVTPELRKERVAQQEAEFEKSNFRLNQRRMQRFRDAKDFEDLPDFERSFMRSVYRQLMDRYEDLTRKQQTVFDRICATYNIEFES